MGFDIYFNPMTKFLLKLKEIPDEIFNERSRICEVSYRREVEDDYTIGEGVQRSRARGAKGDKSFIRTFFLRRK